MVVSGHKPDLQMAILTFSMMIIISKISVLKLKKKHFIVCLTLFLEDALYFLDVGFILAGQEAKNSSGRQLILEQPLK
jgi:hypothetical protein